MKRRVLTDIDGERGLYNREGRALVEVVARNGLAVASSLFQKRERERERERERQDHIHEWTAQDRIRSADSPETAAMEN